MGLRQLTNLGVNLFDMILFLEARKGQGEKTHLDLGCDLKLSLRPKKKHKLSSCFFSFGFDQLFSFGLLSTSIVVHH